MKIFLTIVSILVGIIWTVNIYLEYLSKKEKETYEK
jgi:hypothetical protein